VLRVFGGAPGARLQPQAVGAQGAQAEVQTVPHAPAGCLSPCPRLTAADSGLAIPHRRCLVEPQQSTAAAACDAGSAGAGAAGAAGAAEESRMAQAVPVSPEEGPSGAELAQMELQVCRKWVGLRAPCEAECQTPGLCQCADGLIGPRGRLIKCSKLLRRIRSWKTSSSTVRVCTALYAKLCHHTSDDALSITDWAVLVGVAWLRLRQIEPALSVISMHASRCQ